MNPPNAEPSAPPRTHRPHQGRIHRKPELMKSRPYPLELIQQAHPVLESLDRLRCMTSLQVANLFFLNQPNQHGEPRSPSAARKAANDVCLSRLKDRGLVEVVPFPIRRGKKMWDRLELNVLTRAGRDELVSHKTDEGVRYQPSWKPGYADLSDFSLDGIPHKLAVTDAIISAAVACRSHGVALRGYWDETGVKQLKESTSFKELTPDALLLIERGTGLQPYLVEVDRGTESVESDKPNSWRTKMRKYERYLKERYPVDPFFPQLPTPIVLTVTTGSERLEHLKDETERIGGQRGYWFTCQEWIDPAAYDFLGAIWRVATAEEPYSALIDQLKPS